MRDSRPRPLTPNTSLLRTRTTRTVRTAATGAVAAVWLALQAVLVAPPALSQTSTARSPERLSYTGLIEKIEAGQVSRIEVDSARGVAQVYLKDRSNTPQEVILFSNPDDNQALFETARDNKVDVAAQSSADSNAVSWFITNALLAFLLIAGLLMILRRSSNASGQAMNFGKSRARFMMEAKTGVTFDNVAGIEEAKEELQEVVTFL
ncbi:ATP-dependent metallopeptidase FtsH/Yme1/Tma family protein, partial [Thermoleptolyngbya sp. M55_K2018_002]|uniref:ATP-dependent metallopeptidase FtsH/Yme1/Tma family protein n=1 Tax=Thermoleptolyngbya sp. M55_K2018_002 TaxID=2747808 RepID=UPI001A010931